MAFAGSLSQVRAALAEERARLCKVFGQIDEALERLEPGTYEQVGAQPIDVYAPGAIAPAPSVRPSSAAPDGRQAANNGLYFYKQGGHAAPLALDAVMVAAPRVPRPLTPTLPPGAAWEPSWDKGGVDDETVAAPAASRSPAPPRTDSGGVAMRRGETVKSKPAGLTRARRSAAKRLSLAVNDVSDRAHKTSSRQIFANADQMKEQVQQAILQPDYDVRELYKTEGCFQAVARSSIFDICGLTLIMLNAVWLGIETDLNEKALLVDADPPFIIVENFFCTCFCAELLIKFMAFSRKTDVLKDSWFVFDSVLVCFMAAETWLLSILVWVTAGSLTANSSSTSVLRVVRLFRMTRAARVARVLKAVPELMVIGHGIVIVARTVVVIFCVLFLVIYTFAIVFTQLAKGTDLEKNVHPNAKCSDMVTTMSTLLLGGILPDFAPTTEDFAAEDFFFAAFFFMFILLAYVTIMNMLIGVLVEVVAVVASVEKETNQVAAVKRVLLKWTPDTDLDGDCRIGVDEFKNMLNNDGCAKDLNDVGVDAIALIDHADFVFRNKDALTFSELLTVVLGLRGRNDTKVQDLVQMRKFLHVEMQRIEASLESLHVSLVGESSRPDDVKTGKSFGNLQHEASVVTRDTTTYRSDVIVRNSELSEAILDADQTIELMESEAPVQRPVDDDEVTPIDPKADW